jgi:hypothetical protein
MCSRPEVMFTHANAMSWKGDFHTMFGISVGPTREEPWIGPRLLVEEVYRRREGMVKNGGVGR